jgi:outer membrane receptor protein involved in Fe transport
MLASLILLQAAAAAAPESAAQQGVISYPASFFAAQQPNSANEMLTRIPGFTLDTGDSVRGFEGAAGNVLIDGQRPSSKNDNLQEVLQRLPASQVERIDIIRGGAPGIDMQGKTVLANIIRKQGPSFRGLAAVANNHIYDGRDALSVRLEASGDLGGGRKFELSARGGKGVDDGNGDGAGTRIFTENGQRRTVRTSIDSEGDVLQGIGAAVFETPLAGGQVRLNGRVLKDKYKGEENALLLPPDTGLEQALDINKTLETEIGGRYTRNLGPNASLEAVGLRQDRDRDISSRFRNGEDSAFFLDRKTSETIGRAVLRYRLSPELSFEAGGEVALNQLESATRFTVDGSEVDVPAANVEVEELRSEGFAKATWRPNPAWTVDGGVRYETSRITSEGDVELEKTLRFLKPRLAVTWQPRESTQLRLRIEREVGQLNFDDFVASSSLSNGAGVMAGNPDINPQQAWVFEAALEQRFWKDGAVVLTYRRFELKDVIDRGPVFLPVLDAQGNPVLDDQGQPRRTIFDTPTNIGDGAKDEVALELTVPLSRFGLRGAQLKGDVTLRDSEVVDPTTFETREISRLRPLDWNASYTHDVAAWKMSYGLSAFGGWRESSYRFNAISVVKLKTYVIAFAEYRPRRDVNIRFEVQNLTSRGLRLTRYSFSPTRTVGATPDVDDRDLQFGRMYSVRVRKTFGG